MRAANVPVPLLPVVQAWRAGSVAVINDVYGAVQTWIAGLPASPIRDFLHQRGVSVRATALSVVGIRVGARPSCVSTGDCSGQDFSGQDLTALYAPNGDFTGANFTGTTLSYAILNNADLTSANLTNANLTNAILYTAHLTSANLTNANLTNANLADAGLSYANLSYANLIDANLEYALKTGATWYQTTCPNGTVSDTVCSA